MGSGIVCSVPLPFLCDELMGTGLKTYGFLPICLYFLFYFRSLPLDVCVYVFGARNENFLSKSAAPLHGLRLNATASEAKGFRAEIVG